MFCFFLKNQALEILKEMNFLVSNYPECRKSLTEKEGVIPMRDILKFFSDRFTGGSNNADTSNSIDFSSFDESNNNLLAQSLVLPPMTTPNSAVKKINNVPASSKRPATAVAKKSTTSSSKTSTPATSTLTTSTTTTATTTTNASSMLAAPLLSPHGRSTSASTTSNFNSAANIANLGKSDFGGSNFNPRTIRGMGVFTPNPSQTNYLETVIGCLEQLLILFNYLIEKDMAFLETCCLVGVLPYLVKLSENIFSLKVRQQIAQFFSVISKKFVFFSFLFSCFLSNEQKKNC